MATNGERSDQLKQKDYAIKSELVTDLLPVGEQINGDD